jgi:hypothetical protein
MTKVGILVHCRHLETVAWEELVYGIPAEDKLGDLATLARVVLTLEPTEKVETAAKLFAEKGVEKVVQICAASHASRCIKEQAVARSHGAISKNQLWQTVTTDMTYHNTKPEDIAVIEPLHRRDQPMTFVRPGFSEVIAPYFFLPDADKKELIQMVADFMTSRK